MKIHEVPTPSLHAAINALNLGHLRPPFTAIALERFGVRPLGGILISLHERGLEAGAIASALELVLEEREGESVAPELVWTGPSVGLQGTRDTSVVAQDLFRRARRKVLLACYVVYEGKKLFAPLKREPGHELEIRIVLNVKRDEDPEVIAASFLDTQWPDGLAAPKLFYDPRASRGTLRPYHPSMHAKVIVIDSEHALVTSANFTEAAHRRNIEAGVLLHDAAMARALTSSFEDLITHGHLEELV